MKRIFTVVGVAATALIMVACSPVTLKPDAAEIELLDADRVTKCDRLGKTRVSVATKLLFIPRGDKAIREDLTRLARNSAIEMDGDTLTRESEIQEGEQTFGVYKCIE